MRPTGKTGTGKSGTVTKPTSADVRKGYDEMGKLRKTDPTRAKEILTTSSTLGRVHDAAVRTAVGKLGGVYDSPYRGGDTIKDYPWGFSCHDDGDVDFFFGFSFGWGWGSCAWSWWPCYVGWYYPYYCSTYYPWYYYQSCYADPVYTTI